MFKKIIVKHALNHPTIVFLRDLNSCASYTVLFLPSFFLLILPLFDFSLFFFLKLPVLLSNEIVLTMQDTRGL